jgi:hypothetical protein
MRETHPGSDGGTAVTSDGEELNEGCLTGREVGLSRRESGEKRRERRTGKAHLLLEKSVDEEEIAGGLELGVTETAEGLVGVTVPSLRLQAGKKVSSNFFRQGMATTDDEPPLRAGGGQYSTLEGAEEKVSLPGTQGRSKPVKR